MTQEEKELLFVDLCARLPYGVKCQMEDKLIIDDSPFYNCTLTERYIELFRNHKDFYIKPYLRQISSMTEEEQKEFAKFHCVNICPIIITEELTISNEAKMFEWLNKKMFDYRGLIPLWLALEAPEGMYNN